MVGRHDIPRRIGGRSVANHIFIGGHAAVLHHITHGNFHCGRIIESLEETLALSVLGDASRRSRNLLFFERRLGPGSWQANRSCTHRARTAL